jgi:dihydrofolate synthase/folylpolyglutamate synthase
MGDPHRNFRSIHIAGTNGKGTTAFIIAEILRKSGYKTGLYISPHLINITERIKLNLNDISEIVLYNYLKQIDEILQNRILTMPTYFDILTTAAFKFFSDESVDMAVIETGLGGRLDSTNVIIPEISVITEISFDHTHILGDTIEKIAEEKCGIIKDGTPVITSCLDISAIKVIEKYAAINHSDLYLYNRHYNSENIFFKNGFFTFDYIFNKYRLREIQIPLFPEHQVINTSAALTAISLLRSSGFPEIKDDTIYSTLETIKIPGRFEILYQNPVIIYDPAHNFNALNNLIKGLNKLYHNKRIIFLISLMADKSDVKTLSLFDPFRDNVIYYKFNDSRAFIPEDNCFKQIVSDDDNAFNLMNAVCNDDVIFIFTGTFRIYGSALRITDMFRKYNQSNKCFQERL